MASALIGEGKEGVAWLQAYDMWSPARQYMIYHGQPRILTEIASGQLADPYVNPQKGRPLGPQEPHWNFPVPYSKDTWTLGQQVDYGITAALAGMAARRQVRQRVALQLLPRAPRLGDLQQGPVRLHRPGHAARSVRDLRDARHPEVRRRRDSQVHRRIQRQRQGVPGRLVGDQDRATVRRVRQDDAREADLSGPARVPGRAARAAVRRHRPYAVDADGRHRRCGRQAVRRAARAA